MEQASAAPVTDTTAGLSYDELLHFAEHGWVVKKDVLTQQQCDEYIELLDHTARTRTPVGFDRSDSPGDVTLLQQLIFYDDAFLNWYKLPGILDINRQLIGHPNVRHGSISAQIRVPDADRHERKDELLDPDRWPWWHRILRPRWGNFPHETDPRLLHCGHVNNVTLLTSIAPGNGSTALLDGSHKLEGTYDSLKDQCELVQPEASAGSVMFFAESLLHSPVPIVSEITRYMMLYSLILPWFGDWAGEEVPAGVYDTLRDETLREILQPTHYPRHDSQYPV